MHDVFWRWPSLAGSLFVALFLMLAPLQSAAQVPDDLPLQTLEEAVGAGDVGALMRRASDRLEMAVLGSGMLYSRGQAIYVMEKFFHEHPPRTFSIEKVARADASWFATGRYRARGEEGRYTVYLRLQQAAGRWELIEIRISGGP